VKAIGGEKETGKERGSHILGGEPFLIKLLEVLTAVPSRGQKVTIVNRGLAEEKPEVWERHGEEEGENATRMERVIHVNKKSLKKIYAHTSEPRTVA